jgi:molybdenum cofactor cytidylyltransferase
MGLTRLSGALRLPDVPRLALVGSGGKTTSMFRIANELRPPVLVTATTHLAESQTRLASQHFAVETSESLCSDLDQVTGPVALFTRAFREDARTSGLDGELLNTLYQFAEEHGLPLLVEADGSRQKPLKAPAEHEPALPAWARQVAVVAGMSGLGKPLSAEWVHRPEMFARISGLSMGAEIGIDDLAKVLGDPQGGMKDIQEGAEVSVVLNQVDTDEDLSAARELARKLLPETPRVVIACLAKDQIHAVIEPAAGVILAAGEARRMGQPKQLMDWHGKPFVRAVAETALAAGLAPVVVVSGQAHSGVEQALDGLPVTLVHNPGWMGGQGTSVAVGVKALPPQVGSAVFLLADQPQVSAQVIERLVESHAGSLAPITAPEIGGKRANPVIFDRRLFAELAELSGEAGGRAVFARHPVSLLPWDDDRLLMDVDTPEDYARLLAMDNDG